jgi:hypothetical protein
MASKLFCASAKLNKVNSRSEMIVFFIFEFIRTKITNEK